MSGFVIFREWVQALSAPYCENKREDRRGNSGIRQHEFYLNKFVPHSLANTPILEGAYDKNKKIRQSGRDCRSEGPRFARVFVRYLTFEMYHGHSEAA
jgi:hypothetical protein